MSRRKVRTERIFECSIEPIRKSGGRTLFTGPRDFEFEHVLESLVTSLGGKIPRSISTKARVLPPRHRLNNEAILVFLQLMQKSPCELQNLQNQLDLHLKSRLARRSRDLPRLTRHSRNANLFLEPFDCDTPQNGAGPGHAQERENLPANGQLLGKRGDSSDGNSFFSFKA